MTSTWVFRADAGRQIGTGHVTRLLSVATKWMSEGGNALFVGHAPYPLVNRVADRGARWLTPHSSGLASVDFQSHKLIDLCREHDAGVVFLDGYDFDPEYVTRLVESNIRVVQFADGIIWPEYCADIVVDQNLGSELNDYPMSRSGSRQLLGSRYVALDPSFAEYVTGSKKHKSFSGSVLVTFGGSDDQGATLRVIDALMNVEEATHVTVVVGSANVLATEIEKKLNGIDRFEVVNNTKVMVNLMAGSDVAIAAAGTTSWELVAMGVVPVLLATAENQVSIANALGKSGAAVNIGNIKELKNTQIENSVRLVLRDSKYRKGLLDSANGLIDGCGSSRVIAAVREVTQCDDRVYSSINLK